MPETSITIVMHGVTLAGVLALVGLGLHQHGVWIRIKDRMNVLWRDRCVAKGDDFVPLEGNLRR